MMIRAEQMTVFENAAEDNFVRRIATHLLENYAKAIVRLPEDEQSAVDELPEEKLHSLVGIGIERARRYGLSFESSIAAFSALMFEVAPNFDSHRLSQVLLHDESLEPDARLDELVEVLTEKNWETIRGEYDVKAWRSEPETVEITNDAEKSDDVKKSDFAATVMNIAPPEKPKNPVAIDDINFDATFINTDAAKKIDNSGKAANFDFPDTVLNIDVSKE